MKLESLEREAQTEEEKNTWKSNGKKFPHEMTIINSQVKKKKNQ